MFVAAKFFLPKSQFITNSESRERGYAVQQFFLDRFKHVQQYWVTDKRRLIHMAFIFYFKQIINDVSSVCLRTTVNKTLSPRVEHPGTTSHKLPGPHPKRPQSLVVCVSFKAASRRDSYCEVEITRLRHKKNKEGCSFQ